MIFIFVVARTGKLKYSDVKSIFELAGGAGFSLWGVVLARTTPHRLKPAPQNHRTTDSVYSPKTRRKASEISPTVE
jgi:hypothetical protein